MNILILPFVIACAAMRPCPTISGMGSRWCASWPPSWSAPVKTFHDIWGVLNCIVSFDSRQEAEIRLFVCLFVCLSRLFHSRLHDETEHLVWGSLRVVLWLLTQMLEQRRRSWMRSAASNRVICFWQTPLAGICNGKLVYLWLHCRSRVDIFLSPGNSSGTILMGYISLLTSVNLK